MKDYEDRDRNFSSLHTFVSKFLRLLRIVKRWVFT